MSDASTLVSADGDGVVIAVHVQPQAGRTAVVGRHGDALKVRVAAPPVDDRANDATIEVLAEMLGVPASAIAIVSGARSRVKRFRVEKLDIETATELVDRALEAAAERPGPRQRRQR